jgi:formate-dependent nitrite reductase membrane component NrfD
LSETNHQSEEARKMEGQIHFHWDWIVVIYLFLAGISAGAFAISSLAYFIGKETHERIVRIGAYIAPFPVLIGTLCLIYDLERPHLFWKLFLTFQPSSVMSLGAWLLLLFSLVSFLHFYLWLPDHFDFLALLQWLPHRFAEMNIIKAIKSNSFLGSWRRENLLQWRGWVALIGILLSICVGIYTGVLLGAVVARPFWNNPILPLLFLLSAMKTGIASILLVGFFLIGFKKMKQEEMDASELLIHFTDLILVVLCIIAVFLFIFGLCVSTKSSCEAVKLIMGGEFTLPFWLLVVGVGMLLPLAIEVYELIPHYNRHAEPSGHSPWISVIFATSVLVGGFALRYVVIYAGQISQTISS